MRGKTAPQRESKKRTAYNTVGKGEEKISARSQLKRWGGGSRAGAQGERRNVEECKTTGGGRRKGTILIWIGAHV